MKQATRILIAYIRRKEINFFAFPVLTGSGVKVAIIAPDILIDCVENGAPVIERRTGELFGRMARCYKATQVNKYLKPIALLDTPYKAIKDIPKHEKMQARGFEIVTALASGGIHRGDDISAVDVSNAPQFGNIECKFGSSALTDTRVMKWMNWDGEKILVKDKPE